MNEEGKRILVAGAIGYLGSFVAWEFKNRGHSVRALARSSHKLDPIRDSLDEVVQAEVTTRGDQTVSSLGRYFGDIGYGYQWWSATLGDHRVDCAAGHGGQLIVLLRDLDMIIVNTRIPCMSCRFGRGGASKGRSWISWAGSSQRCQSDDARAGTNCANSGLRMVSRSTLAGMSRRY